MVFKCQKFIWFRLVHVCVAMLAALAEEMAGICDILIFMSGEDLVTYTY